MSRLQEEHVSNCLDIAFKANIPKQQRKARVAKSPDWLIMEKKWRSILTLALDETEIPGDDDDVTPSRNHRMMRRRNRGTTPKSALDWLPNNDAIAADESESNAFKLAVLLINKQLKRGDWSDDLTTLENATREHCLSEGVHKIWHTLGQKTALLAQFNAFPVAKKKTKSSAKVDINLGRIDVFDNHQLGNAISALSPLCKDAAQQIAIQKVQSQISTNRGLEVSADLLGLTGKASIISVILAIASGESAEEAIKQLAKVNQNLADEFSDLTKLMDGIIDDWTTSTSNTDTGLGRARLRFAWLNFPESVKELSPEEIAAGIEVLKSIPNAHVQLQNLSWIHLSALARTGK
ncbi:MAG TPA: hypothetical protein HA327_04125, partial [Candidatus Poseidoniaceae archaeon]